MRFTNLNARAWRSLTVVAFVALLALSGAARVGHAATNGQLRPPSRSQRQRQRVDPRPADSRREHRLRPEPQQPSTNTLNHIVASDTVPSPATVVFFSAPPGVSCSGLGTNTLTCTSSQLTAGAQFDVIVLFSTDPAGTPGTGVVHNDFSGTYAPQSQNTSNNRTDPTKTFGASTHPRYAGGTACSSRSRSCCRRIRTGRDSCMSAARQGSRATSPCRRAS